MLRLLSGAFGATVLSLALVGSALAGQIWTDLDGDGLPGGTVFGETSDTFEVDIWIDSQSFSFTEFQAAIDIGSANFAGPATVLAGCTGETVDGGSTIIVSGKECATMSGVIKVGSFFMHINDDCVVCPIPIIEDVETPGKEAPCFGDTSRLVSPTGLFCFSTAGNDCVDCNAPTATDETTWGSLKGLYR